MGGPAGGAGVAVGAGPGGARVGTGDGGPGAGLGGAGAGADFGGGAGGSGVRGGGSAEVAGGDGAGTVTLAWARSWPIAAVTTAVPGPAAVSTGPLTATTSGREEVQVAARACAGALPPLSSVPARVAVTDWPGGMTMTGGVMVRVWSWTPTMAF